MTVRLGPLGGVLLDVGLDVEVREQDEEHPTVEQNYVAEYLWEAAVLDKEGEGGVDEESHELHQLHCCQVPLPPKVLLHLGPEGGEEVVEVHDDVDPHVQEPAERRVSPANKSDPPPGCEGHNSVVYNVQRRQMAELLPENEEEAVEVVDVLAEEVPPGHV